MITEEEFKHLTPDQRDRIRDQINDLMGNYLITRCGISNPARSGNFRCPVCGHSEMHYYPDTNKVRCFSGKGCHDPQPYDLIDLIGKLRGIQDYNGKLYAAMNELGISTPNAAITQGSTPRSNPGVAAALQLQRKAPNPEGITMFIRQAAGSIEGSKAADYMNGRGFDLSFLQEMRIGYDQDHNAVVIPYSAKPDLTNDYYVMRYIDPRKDDKGKVRRYYKPTGITEPIFHADNLTNGMPYVFVCEGQINALSIEQAGGNAIAVGSTNNGSKLLSYIETLQQEDPEYKSRKTFIIAYDNDEAGIPAERELIGDLTAAGFTAVSANDAGLYDPTETITKPINDANDLLQGDPAALTRRIEKLISKPADVYRDSFSMGSFRSKYQEQRIRNSSLPCISTGFLHLDKVLYGGIRPGLIFLGAVTSIGKSTIIMQIADSIAKQGRDVLVFALEMSRFELVTRSISRESYRIAKSLQIPQPGNALQYHEIADGKPLPENKVNILSQAEDYYFNRIAPHVFIIQGEGGVTVDTIKQQVQQHTELTGTAPVVIVDYLQLLQPPKDAIRWSDKQVVDHNVIALKHISEKYPTPVIAVLSLNRASYNQEVGLSSGKESGAIEYSCDILLGMNQEEKKNADGSRSIYIDILKNRSGSKSKRIWFNYVSTHSYFQDLRSEDKRKDSNAAAQQYSRKGEQDADGFVIG